MYSSLRYRKAVHVLQVSLDDHRARWGEIWQAGVQSLRGLEWEDLGSLLHGRWVKKHVPTHKTLGVIWCFTQVLFCLLYFWQFLIYPSLFLTCLNQFYPLDLFTIVTSWKHHLNAEHLCRTHPLGMAKCRALRTRPRPRSAWPTVRKASCWALGSLEVAK